MKDFFRVMIMDDTPEGPSELYMRAVENDQRFSGRPKIKKEPEIGEKNLLQFDIILLDHDFGAGKSTGSDVLERIVVYKKKNPKIRTKVILISQFKGYKKWKYSMEYMQEIGVISFLDRRTRAPEILKFHLNNAINLLEKERVIDAQGKQLKQRTEKAISMIPIEIAQQKGPSIEKIAQLDGYKPVQSVFIHGNTGTGKGELVRFFREQLANKRGLSVQDIKFSHVNCASFSKELIMGELFGICQGTATNVSEKNGRFADSDGGILFLDEFEELSLENQAQILTVMETGKYYRAHGGIDHKHQTRDCPSSLQKTRPDHTKERSIKNLKLIAAANQNAMKLLDDSKLRSDIFHRFDFTITMADITEYKDLQLEKMIAVFVNQTNNRYRTRNDFKNGKVLTNEAVAKIISEKTKLSGKFGGNLRQVEKWIERALTMTDRREITANDMEDHYLYGMTLQPSTGIKNDLSKGTVKDHEEFDPIVERLINDRDKANATFIKKYGQKSFDYLIGFRTDDKWRDLWEKYKPLRDFKMERNPDYKNKTKQKLMIAEEMKKVLRNKGEISNSQNFVAMSMGMTPNSLSTMKSEFKKNNKGASA